MKFFHANNKYSILKAVHNLFTQTQDSEDDEVNILVRFFSVAYNTKIIMKKMRYLCRYLTSGTCCYGLTILNL